MSSNVLMSLVLASLLAGCATTASTAQSPRIDATSVVAAEDSYRAMMDTLSPEKQRQLALAMLALNLRGVGSAYEAMKNPDLQSLSIGRIKDDVNGMTADEIIALAARTSTVKFEVPARQ